MADAGFRDALGALMSGAADLSGFGLERKATEGIVFAGGIHEFEESLSIDGKGRIVYFLRRPVADGGAKEVGLYQGAAKPEEVQVLLQLLIDSDLDSLTPAHPEPGAMCWGVATVANGRENRFFTGTYDPTPLMRIEALTTELDRWEDKALQGPVWTLSLTAAPQPARNPGWLEFSLEFANRGTEGIWIDHPAALKGASPAGDCHLVFGKAPQIQPGMTPLPMTLEKILLRHPADEPALLWIGPGGKATVKAAVEAPVEAPANGPFLGRIAYVTYPGQDRTAGRRRFAGGLFTADFRF